MKKIAFLCIFYLLVSCAGQPPDNHARAIGWAADQRIVLKAPNGLYVGLEEGAKLIANQKNKKEASRFDLVDLGKNKIGLLSSNEFYVTADLNQRSQLIARGEKILSWEIFDIEKIENNFVYIKATNSKFISLDSNHVLVAKEIKSSTNCLFELIDL